MPLAETMPVAWISRMAVSATARLVGVVVPVMGARDRNGLARYGLLAAVVIEVVMTFGFVTVILGVTDKRAAAFAPAAPLAIGLTLTLIHLISIPVTNTSVNPARSTGPALFVGDWALAQLWLFWVAPLIGGAAGGLLYHWLSPEPSAEVTGVPLKR